MVYTELNDFNVYNLPAFKKFQLCIVPFTLFISLYFRGTQKLFNCVFFLVGTCVACYPMCIIA